jgi:membrane-bound metal-dependent hydrolase YbcI (DUF457 family)
MFVGHFAVGFASKRAAPRTSLALLLAAPLFADILWPIFLALGWEHVRIDPRATRFTPLDLYDFPWSHSLLALALWATLFAGLYWAITRYRPGAIVLWLGVLSHWILDWITHRPDMPLYPGSAKFGLGLWNSIPGTFAVELTIFAAGIWIYLRSTRARDRIGRYAFLAYVLLLLVIYIGDPFSGPPPNVADLIWAAFLYVPVFLLWAWWFDRHRTPLGRLIGTPPSSQSILAKDVISLR